MYTVIFKRKLFKGKAKKRYAELLVPKIRKNCLQGKLNLPCKK